MTEIEIPASTGHPYTVTRDDRGLVRLKRATVDGRRVTIVFDKVAALAVADALVDLTEASQ